jgi:hypothetical protein
MIRRLFFPSARYPAFLVGLIFLLAPVWATAQDAPGETPAGAGYREGVLHRLSEAADRIASIESEFIQESHTAMLDEPLRSEGLFRFEAPDRLRWEVLAPEPFGFSVEGDRVTAWRGTGGEAGSAPPGAEAGIRHFADQIFAWVRADYAWLEERFTLTVAEDPPVTLVLTPLSNEAAEGLEQVRVSFSPDLDHAERIEIVETGGDRTVITFVNSRVLCK